MCAPANGSSATIRSPRRRLRNRTVGMVGMGAIGQAIARRLDAFGVPVVYHTRKPRPTSAIGIIRTCSTWRATSTFCWSSCRAAPATQNMINAEVLEALGPDGILINMARGSVVDEPALIKALQDKRIMAAGLDVFAKEPEVPQELIAMDNVVLFPHLGSASVYTREKMDQLVVDNIVAWAAGKPPLTPVRGDAVAILEQRLHTSLAINCISAMPRPGMTAPACA